MCINKEQIYNRKYSMNKKNGGIVPICNDERQKWILVPCGHCYICRKKKAREWRMRITEDIKTNPNCKIVTLTFNTESLKNLAKECGNVTGYELDNLICKIAVKRFRERWRKKYGRSIRHWLITELGHGETEHVHMHGIVWEDSRYVLEDKLLNEVEKIWGYGWVGKGKPIWHLSTKNNIVYENYVNAKTANYFTKYVNKVDEQHKEYRQIILTSAGIGKSFLDSQRADDNKYRGKKTNQMYNLENGGVLPMPEYFRRKLYTDEQREKLSTWYLDREIIYIEGREYRGNYGESKFHKMYQALRSKNARLGYNRGNKLEKWLRKQKENEHRKQIQYTRYLKDIEQIAPQALRGLGIAPESAESINDSLRSLGAEQTFKIDEPQEWEWKLEWELTIRNWKEENKTVGIQPNYNFYNETD